MKREPKKETIIYNKDGIKVTQTIFPNGYGFYSGKISLGAYNANTGATCTAFVNESNFNQKLNHVINEVKKDTRINLTERLAKIEENYLSSF